MAIEVCGLSCEACNFLGNECKGCRAEAGRVFWTKYYDNMPGCAIYACATEKGLHNCGACAQIPCDKWKTTREPDVTDEEFERSLQARMKNLGK